MDLISYNGKFEVRPSCFFNAVSDEKPQLERDKANLIIVTCIKRLNSELPRRCANERASTRDIIVLLGAYRRSRDALTLLSELHAAIKTHVRAVLSHGWADCKAELMDFQFFQKWRARSGPKAPADGITRCATRPGKLGSRQVR